LTTDPTIDKESMFKTVHLGLALALAWPALALASPECEVPPLQQTQQNPKAAAAALALRATDPCKLVPGLNGKTLKSVWASLLSNRKTGGRRLDTAVPEGLPNGVVLAGPAGVHFDFRDVAGEGLRSFSVEFDHKPLLAGAVPPPELDLPLARTAAAGAGSYAWTLVTRQNSYRGQFTLLDAEGRADVEQQLEALARAELDPAARLLYQAAIYEDAGLYSERDRVFAQLRKLVEL
jgi:hypothetical protein